MVKLDKLNIDIPAEGTAVALGYFDGLHRGHMEVIGRVLRKRSSGLLPCVFTFTTHNCRPSAKVEGLIMSEEQRFAKLEEIGVEYVVCPEFEEFRGLSPSEFVEILAHGFKAKMLCCGEDFRFGKGASADVNMLKELCEPYGIAVETVEKIQWQGEEISSTRLRECIRDGRVGDAAAMLGFPYEICAVVTRGKMLGRRLGFPTANQLIPEGMTIPKEGVYASAIKIDGKKYAAVTNVGRQPTFGGKGIVCESYIIGFDGDLYDRQICTGLAEYLRPVKKFSGAEQLRQQIAYDAGLAEKMINLL